MRRSRLEIYVDILEVLSFRNPVKLTHIMYKANVNCSILKEYIQFLIEQGLNCAKTIQGTEANSPTHRRRTKSISNFLKIIYLFHNSSNNQYSILYA